MAINSSRINSHAVNAGGPVTIYGAGEFISIEQKVARIGGGELVSFEQTVELRASTSADAEFISFEQVVEAVHTGGNLISFEQRILDASPSVPSRTTRTGWDCTLVIGGYQIPNEQIHGSIEIDRTENDAALMSVTLIPPTGTQSIENYHGKVVTLDVHTSSGTTRVYTGTVDIPDIDLYEEKITLRCTDRRTELLNSQLPGVVSTIGVYSPHVFRIPRDTAEEVEQRLTTTPYAVDFDAYGNYTITPWSPKSTPDFTLTDSDIYRKSPRVELTSRGRVTNKVNIKMQYRYERFYHHERNFSWTSPINDNICNLLQYGYSMTFRSVVQQAAEAAGWPLKGNINFTDIHGGGWYRCGGTTIGWSTVSLRGETTAKTDEEGNEVKDSEGNTVYETRITGGTDYGPLYCMAASWTATTQWAQNVTEEYTLTVQAPQSISQFGTITEDRTYAIDEEANSREWENYDSFRTVAGQSGNYTLDQDLKRGEFNAAVSVALQQAKNTILGSHRDTRVTVDTFIWPAIDLKHTVLVNATELTAKGKVFNIKHKLNVGTGEAVTTTTILLSRAQGSSSNSALTVPSKISDTVTFNTQSIRLGNHFGEDPTQASAKGWNGMIGNRWKTENNNTFRTTYQEQFIVDTPAINPILRDARTLTGSSSYNVAIPNDTLSISFNGKS